MSSSVNTVAISGNLTRDPELRATSGGMQVLNFSVAVNERTKDAAGNWGDRPNYVDCVMFGARAEKLAQWLSKGSKVFVQGSLRYSSWEKDGQKRSKLEVVAREVDFTSAKREDAQPAQQQWSAQQAYAKPPATTPQAADVYDEDIPF